MSRRVAAASCVDSAILPPVQRGTCGAFAFAGHHPRRQLAHAHESSTRPAKTNAVAGNEPRHEAFLDVAERLAVAQAHRDARLGDDGPDADPVPAGDRRVGHARDAVVADHDAPVLG